MPNTSRPELVGQFDFFQQVGQALLRANQAGWGSGMSSAKLYRPSSKGAGAALVGVKAG